MQFRTEGVRQKKMKQKNLASPTCSNQQVIYYGSQAKQRYKPGRQSSGESEKQVFEKFHQKKKSLMGPLSRSPRTPTTRQARAGLHLPPATARRTAAAAAGITQAVTRAAFHFATAGAINSGRLRRSRGRALKLAHAAPE